MDVARGAFVPLATDFRLKGHAARRELYHGVGQWVQVPTEELAGSPTLGRADLPGLPHRQKTGPKCICQGPVDLSTISYVSTDSDES